MGGLGDVYHKRRSGGLGEYLKPGALDGLTPAELKALRADVASQMPGVRDYVLQPHGFVDLVGPDALDKRRADRLTAPEPSWREQIAQTLGDAFSTPRYIRPRPSPAGISRELRRQFPGFADYLYNSADALSRMPHDLAGMLADLRADPLDFLSKAGPGLAGLGMAVPHSFPAATAERASGLGDLTIAEVKAIQDIVNQAGRPLQVVGSAARGARTATSDIDYAAPVSSLKYFTRLQYGLPKFDPRHGIIQGGGNPHIGPYINFEPKVP
jgi:hypothetical protein